MDVLGTIQMVLTVAIGVIIYYRLIKREVPEPIGPLQAIVPVVGGVLSNRVLILYILGMVTLTNTLGVSLTGDGLSNAGGAILKAFVIAAFPEELSKGLIMLLVIFLFRKKVRNVYEYILVGTAVGLGFTLIEDLDYVTNGANFLRLALVCGHLCFNMIMGMYLGSARYKKEHNQGPVVLDYVKAFAIPMLWHTLFDAFTAMNPAIISAVTGDLDAMGNVYVALGIVAVIVSIVLQVLVMRKAFKDADRYCAMTFAGQGPAGGGYVTAQAPAKHGKHSRR
ncbi:MAG: PrsW family intramembrane metalloprotease [Atopobiaceae bacterium]|nr:PrsW family intramembrane metalloprotease [Atopobiaceae bacterium]